MTWLLSSGSAGELNFPRNERDDQPLIPQPVDDPRCPTNRRKLI